MAHRDGSTRADIIKAYTQNASEEINDYLRSQIQIIPVFRSIESQKTMIINSTIYHLGTTRAECFSAFNNSNYFVSLQSNPYISRRYKVHRGQRIMESAFLSSVGSTDDLVRVSPFFGPVPHSTTSPVCCLKHISNGTVPLLDVSELSFYPDQLEFMVPYGVVMEYEGLTVTPVTYYPNIKGSKTPISGNDYIYETSGNKMRTRASSSIGREPTTLPVTTYNYRILTTMIDRSLMDYVNRILRVHYFNPDQCQRSYHEWSHICSVMFLSTMVYASLRETAGKDINKPSLNILILAGLFHDIGRECKDGADIYEAESAEIAHRLLSEEPEWSCYANSVRKILKDDDMHEHLRQIKLAVKGADSIDIARVVSFKPESSPLSQAGIAVDPALYNECDVLAYAGIRELLTQRDNFTVKAPEVVTFEDASGNKAILSDHLIWSGPYMLPSMDLTGTAPEAVTRTSSELGVLELSMSTEEDGLPDIIVTKDRSGNFTTILDNREREEYKYHKSLEGLTCDIKNYRPVPSSPKVINIINENHDELKDFIVHIRRMHTTQSNFNLLFDMFLLGVLPLLPSIPAFHRLSSYVHFPYYSPERINSPVISPPRHLH